MRLKGQLGVLVTIGLVVIHAILLGPISFSEEVTCDSQLTTLYESKAEVTTTSRSSCMEPIGMVSVLGAATPVIAAPSKLVEMDGRVPVDISNSTLEVHIYSAERLPDYLRISIYNSASTSLRSPISLYECFGERIIYTDTEDMCNSRYVASEDQRSMRLTFALEVSSEHANSLEPDHCNLLVEAVWLPSPVLPDGPFTTDHQWWQLPFSVR